MSLCVAPSYTLHHESIWGRGGLGHRVPQVFQCRHHWERVTTNAPLPVCFWVSPRAEVNTLLSQASADADARTPGSSPWRGLPAVVEALQLLAGWAGEGLLPLTEGEAAQDSLKILPLAPEVTAERSAEPRQGPQVHPGSIALVAENITASASRFTFLGFHASQAPAPAGEREQEEQVREPSHRPGGQTRSGRGMLSSRSDTTYTALWLPTRKQVGWGGASGCHQPIMALRAFPGR